MKNLNKITKILGAAFVLATSGTASAATVNSIATVTVTNVITLTEDAVLDFGSVRATADSTDAGASIVLDSQTGLISAGPAIAGTAGVVNAALSSLSVGNAGSYTVSDAATFTEISLTLPANGDVTLAATGVPGTNPIFEVIDFEATVFGGTNDGAIATTSTNLLTDSAGTVSFNVGARLTTDTGTTNSETYIDADYTGSYAIIVEY